MVEEILLADWEEDALDVVWNNITANTFCATGEGGGVDSSCSGKSSKGVYKSKKVGVNDVYQRAHIALLHGVKDEQRSTLLDDVTKLSKKDAQSLHTRLGLKGSSKDAGELRSNLVNELVRKSADTPSSVTKPVVTHPTVKTQLLTTVKPTTPVSTTTTQPSHISSPEDKGRVTGSTKGAVPDEHVSHVTDAISLHGTRHNLADLVDIRKHLESKGVVTREQQDAAVYEATKRGLIYGSAYEGRHGVTPAQRQAEIRHEGHVGTGFLSLSKRTNNLSHTSSTLNEGEGCGTGKGGFQKGNTCSKGSEEGKSEGEKGVEKDTSANRPSLPSERHEGLSPTPVEWVDPPPKKGKKGVGKVTRPKGEESQTVIGDLGEDKAIALGFRNILPKGKRSFTAEEVKKKGSSIDLEFDHSGKLYEAKLCNDTSTEYRLKASKKQKDDKLRYAKNVEAVAYTMVPIRDTEKNEIHYYVAKEPGLTGAEVNSKNFDYLGKVKVG